MSFGAEEGIALVRRARRATGLGQKAFARLVGLCNTTVWAWEHGHRVPARRMRSLLRLVEADPEWCVEVLRAAQAHEESLSASQELPAATGASEGGVEAGKAVSDAGEVSPAKRVLERTRALGRETRGRVALDRLRRALPELPRGHVDRELRRLEALGHLSLQPALFPGCLNADERRAVLPDPERGDLLFVEIRESAGEAGR